MNNNNRRNEIAELERRWKTDPRWKGVTRSYSAADVVRLRGSAPIEYTLAERGYRAVKHQAFVGAGYFDAVAQTISGGASSTTALTGSTEEAQFSR